MTKKSSTQKGNELESLVYEAIKRLVENGEFFNNDKHSKINRKKSYLSKTKKSSISTDISIETFLHDSTNYSTLTVIECKNHTKNVLIEDIQKFESKLNRIGEQNIQGLIFTTSSFQTEAIAFAQSKKIGLVRMIKQNRIVYRIDKKPESHNIELIKSYLSSNNVNNDFYAFIQNISFETLPSLLINIGIIDRYANRLQNINTPQIKNNEIETKISQLPSDIYLSGKLDIDLLCHKLSQIYKIEFIYNETLGHSNGNQVLGKINFNPLKIFISQDLSTDICKRKYVLARVIGHFMLHRELLQQYFNDYIDVEIQASAISEDYKFLKIQADKFARTLLLPEQSLKNDFSKYKEQLGFKRPYLYEDSQSGNIKLVSLFLSKILAKHEVSPALIRYRLKELKLLETKNTLTSINNLL